MEASTAPRGLRMGDEMSEWAHLQYLDKYSWKDENGEPTEDWRVDTAKRVITHPLKCLGYDSQSLEVQALIALVAQRKFIPAGRYLATTGREFHQVCNCFLYRCEDSREGWADLVRKAILGLSSGGGIGVDYSEVRPSGSLIGKTGGRATGPISPASMVNEVARHVMSGGFRRSAIWGGLRWDHSDIFAWISAKDWSASQKLAKAEDYNASAPLDMTNISVILNDEFFEAYADSDHEKHWLAEQVYWTATEHMLRHGEPGFSINTGDDAHESLRNACCEITSHDDSDVCNLGSINLARVESKEELQEIVHLGILFLLAGTVYSDVPHEEVHATRSKNRRLGLGLMGVHEWLIARGYRYEVVDELREWLEIYATSGEHANAWADMHQLTRPVKTRAIAPNGTIGIIGETTTSAEPVFCAAYKRRFLDVDTWKFQYVIDPTVQHMKDHYGIDPDAIDTAYTLDPERRIKFQADLQEYVDHGISSTINIDHPIVDPDELRVYGEIFMDYLPKLRGFTCYPNGARSGQPLEAVTYEEAIESLGVSFEENREAQCFSGSCGV